MMTHAAIGTRTLTELDHARIERLLTRSNRPSRDEPLHCLLEDANIVAPRQVPPDVVTMYALVTVEDPDGGARRKFSVCYPEDAEPNAGFVSVLSPIGTALLGRRRGETIEWVAPTGSVQRLRIVELLFQPEASGDYTM